MLPDNFRKKTFTQRLSLLNEYYAYQATGDNIERADSLIENAVGFVQIPVGIAGPLIIDNQKRFIPVATEEPSVLMALNYGALIINRAGGVNTDSSPSIVTGQVAVLSTKKSRRARSNLYKTLNRHKARYTEILKELLATLHARGGGLHNCTVQSFRLHRTPYTNNRTVNKKQSVDTTGITETHAQRDHQRFGCLLEFTVNTVDAMGANRINTAAEHIAHHIHKDIGIKPLISILSNSLDECITSAHFTLPVAQLPKHSYALKIVQATQFAFQNHKRAVTHNKGIMNAISGIALATGNDTRALEAAIHSFASHKKYTPLTSYRLDNKHLCGTLSAPLCLATKGGRIGVLRSTQSMLTICQIQNAKDLRLLAAAAGLIQNFAALLSLVSTGIQHGHMYYHCKDIAFQAGARDGDIDLVARTMIQHKQYSLQFAKQQFEILQNS